jgi:hypothetical protein
MVFEGEGMCVPCFGLILASGREKKRRKRVLTQPEAKKFVSEELDTLLDNLFKDDEDMTKWRARKDWKSEFIVPALNKWIDRQSK